MSFPEIKSAIDDIAGAFTAFKRTNDERHAELLDRVETIEAKRSGAGLNVKPESKTLGDLAFEAVERDAELLSKTRSLRVELKAAGDPITTSDGRSILFAGVGAPTGGVLGMQVGLPIRRVDGISAIEYTRYTGSEGAAAQQTAEGGAKAAMKPTFTMVTQSMLQFAGYTKISRQAMTDRHELAQAVNVTLARSLNTVIDAGLYSGATGFVGGFAALATAYTSLVYTGMADTISEGVATMEQAGFAPNVVFLSPADWLAVVVAKGSDLHYLSGAYLGEAQRSLRGLRVVRSPSIAAGKALLVDTLHVELGMTTFSFEVAYAGDDFTKNLSTALLEVRVAPVMRATGAMRLLTPKA